MPHIVRELYQISNLSNTATVRDIYLRNWINFIVPELAQMILGIKDGRANPSFSMFPNVIIAEIRNSCV